MSDALRRTVDVVHLLALVTWIAMLAAAGGAAMGVFITLPTLDVRIESLAPVLGDDADLHGRVAGGMVMRPVFQATDRGQAIAAGVAMITLLLQLAFDRRRWPLRSVAVALRSICVVAAATLVILHALSFAPRMDGALLRSWDALRSGDRTGWQSAREEFDVDHRRADTLFRVRLALVVVAVGVFAVGGAGGGAATPTSRAESAR